MTFPLPVPDALRSTLSPGSSVLLGISGGVDSSVALALLSHLGCRVHCVTFKNFCTGDSLLSGPESRSCCSEEAICEARSIAARFNARHDVGNVEARFRDQVIDPFVSEYLGGRTPNPCVNCNTSVRFPRLVEMADLLGLDYVATGHYARVERDSAGAHLYRGRDPEKDQSYFLHGMGQPILERCVFPLGTYTKHRIRQAAADLDLSSARKPDSQEICFVPDGDRRFLFDGRGGLAGDVVDTGGHVLGRHGGLENYTIGQRRGLAVSSAQRLYVIDLDTVNNRLVLGMREDLRVDRIRIDRRRFFDEADFLNRIEVLIRDGLNAQIRYRHVGVRVAAVTVQGETLEIELREPVEGVAPGQFLVFYAQERVLGGGRIIAAVKRS